MKSLFCIDLVEKHIAGWEHRAPAFLRKQRQTHKTPSAVVSSVPSDDTQLQYSAMRLTNMVSACVLKAVLSIAVVSFSDIIRHMLDALQKYLYCFRHML